MNNLDKLEAQVKEMQAEIERLKAWPSKLNGIAWKPKCGNEYFYLSRGEPRPFTWANDGTDKTIFAAQRVYPTKVDATYEQAVQQAKMKVLRRVAELNHQSNWVCDWNNKHQTKYRPQLDLSASELTIGSSRFVSIVPTTHYAALSVWDQVFREMEADVKLGLFGISS